MSGAPIPLSEQREAVVYGATQWAMRGRDLVETQRISQHEADRRSAAFEAAIATLAIVEKYPEELRALIKAKRAAERAGAGGAEQGS